MSYAPNAGAMDQRVIIQQRATGLDAHGQESTTWQDLATVWARVTPLRGRDFIAAAQMQATFDARVHIRYRTDVTAGMRLMWGAQPLELVGAPVDVDGGRHTLELMCVHGVRAGAPA